MLVIGQYILYGIIAIFAIGVAVMIGMLLLNSRKEKLSALESAQQPREDSLAEQIQKQFSDEREAKDRIIYNKSGITKAKTKETRSAFSFASDDSDNELTLESEFADDDAKEPFIDRNSADNI